MKIMTQKWSFPLIMNHSTITIWLFDRDWLISRSPSPPYIITHQYTVLLSDSSRGRIDCTKKRSGLEWLKDTQCECAPDAPVCVSIWGQTPLYHIPSGSMVSVNEMGKKRAVLYNHTLLRAQETRHRRVCLHSFSFPSMSRYLTIIHHAENIELNWYDINPPLRSPLKKSHPHARSPHSLTHSRSLAHMLLPAKYSADEWWCVHEWCHRNSWEITEPHHISLPHAFFSLLLHCPVSFC